MERDWVSPPNYPYKIVFLELTPCVIYVELYFRQQVMTVVFGYGKLHQAMFGDQLEVWVWNKRKR
jgi:hypothetical protein